MAGRKNKNTVDYFPHYCISGKTLFIIESKFGHIGYAIWYKTLELLGASENHFIDLRNETDLLFLISKLKITEQQLTDIYDLLAKLDAIDSFLWSKKIVFSENFINNVEDAYVRRKGNDVLHKLDLCKHLSIKCKQESTDYTILDEIKPNKNNDIDEIYNLYPSKCPIKKNSTGKGSENKKKIKSLLKDKTVKELKDAIEFYIDDCKKHNVYIKNFSTFLNNIPDIDEIPQGERMCLMTSSSHKVPVEKPYSFYLKELSYFGSDEVKLIKLLP